MQTSSFRVCRLPGQIAIMASCKQPRRFGVQLSIPQLAPAWAWIGLPFPEYKLRFQSKLAELDPQAMWDMAHQIAKPYEPILVCTEVPPFHAQNWCHRRLVAKWFQDTLGHAVPEYGHGCVPCMPDLFN